MSDTTTVVVAMLFCIGLQIIGRDWSFWTRFGALLMVSPLGVLVGRTLAMLDGMAG